MSNTNPILDQLKSIQHLTAEEVESLRYCKAVDLVKDRYSKTLIAQELGGHPNSILNMMKHKDEVILGAPSAERAAEDLGIPLEYVQERISQLQKIQRHEHKNSDVSKFVDPSSYHAGLCLSIWLHNSQWAHVKNTHIGYVLGMNRQDVSLLMQGQLDLTVSQLKRVCMLIGKTVTEVLAEAERYEG